MSVTTVELSEWTKLGLLEDVSFDDERTRSIAADLDKAGTVSIVELARGLSITTKSHVGSLQLGSLQLQIRPKIEGAPLAALLRYAYRLRDLRLLGQHRARIADAAFQDILLEQLIAEVNELMARGLHRRYRRREESLARPRGRFDFNRIAKGPGLVEARLPCRHHVRLEDCLPNQVLLAALRLGVKLTHDRTLRTSLRRTAAVLSERVAAIQLTPHVLLRNKRESNRQLAAYEPAFRLTELLVAGCGAAIRGEDAGVSVPGFLFDMNTFFQQLLSRFLRENLPSCDFRDEVGLKTVFEYESGFNPQNKKAPVPRPDFVVMSRGKVAAVLDAKYRDLWVHSVPSNMLYQLAIYALGQPDVDKAAILYPTMSKQATEARLEIRDPVRGGRRGTIVLRPVHLGMLAQLVEGGRTTTRERRDLADQLAFGAVGSA